MYKSPHFTSFLTKSLLVILFCSLVAISVAAKASDSTINNLNKALKGETNASHRYELFAKKADDEGYRQIGKLFRAISMSESIHRNNHKAAILALGGKPDVINYDPVTVGTTKENLLVPLKKEAYEKDTMYPKFIKQAKADGASDAVKSFSYAMNAEKQHEKLFKEALDGFGKNKPADYFVHKVTGATYAINYCAMCPFKKFGPDKDYIRVK